MKTLNVFIITVVLVIAGPVLAEIGPEFGTKIEITFDDYSDIYDCGSNHTTFPAISPDGKWIAFMTFMNPEVRDLSSGQGIWIVPAEGGEARLLYMSEWDTDCLRFTPDSKVVAFQRTVDTPDPDDNYRLIHSSKTIQGVNIYTGVHQVILEGAGRARWSHDGRYISYINYDERVYTDELAAEHNAVPTIYDTVTGEKRYLTNENLPARTYKYIHPTISPDNKFVYVGIRGRFNDSGIGQLFRIPFEGGDFEQLTFFEDVRGYCSNLNFSPDGVWLIFDYSWGTGVYVYNTITGQTFDAFTGEEINKPYFQEEYGWEDNPSWMPNGTTFCYNMWFGGRNDYQDKIEIYICGFDAAKYAVLPTFVENENPSSFTLLRNYPNPFNPATTIEFTIPEAEFVDLVIYDITGRKIRELMSCEMAPGVHSVFWDGRDDKGSPVSSGVFISRLKTGDNVVSNRMMLVK